MASLMDLDPKLYVVDTINGHLTDTFGDNIPSIFANLSHHDKPLVIWFHGALVTRDRGLAGAHLGLYGNDQLHGFLSQDVEAIYYVYESGPVYEGLKAATFLLADDLIQSKLSYLESFLRPIVNNVVANMVTKLHEGIQGFLRWLHGDPVVRMRLRALSMGQGSAFALQALANPTAYTEEEVLRAKVHAQMVGALTPADASRNAFGFALNIDFASLLVEFGVKAVKVATRVVERFQGGREHGLSQTIIEEIVREYLQIGPETWRQIKSEVNRAFADTPGAAGTTLVAGLKRYLADHPDRPVYLVGHSTGSIYLARFVMKAKEMGMSNRFHLRLLAGAARMDLYNQMFDAAGDRVAEIVTYGMGDDVKDPAHNYEHQEYLFAVPPIDKTPIKYLYQGSLLYMVSGALEDGSDQPLMGMQRFYVTPQGKPSPPGDPQLKFNVIQVWSDTPAAQGQRATKSHSHGGFSEDPETFNSILL